MNSLRTLLRTTLLGAGLAALVAAAPAAADQQILDDLIVDGSICAGLDCVNGESFGFDTLRLKENNLRIRFFDTSSSASFPTRDWQVTANDSSNGGQNKFSIDDIDAGRTPFTIEADADAHALYVDTGGRIGFGTSTPVVELHVKDGDTPTLRLEQDGSSGFTPQTWDLAGNETNFFIRDVTNGSKLPFRIRPNAPTSAIDVEGNTGDVGIGTSSPTASVHVRRADGTAFVQVEEVNSTAAVRTMLKLTNKGGVRFDMENTNVDATWRFGSNNAMNQLTINHTVNPGTEFDFSETGNLTVLGNLFSSACTFPGSPCAPDYVFEPDYALMPIAELAEFVKREKHLPNVPSAEELTGPVNISKMQMTLLEKIEELVLYTLDQQETIDGQQQVIDELRGRLEALEAGTAAP